MSNYGDVCSTEGCTNEADYESIDGCMMICENCYKELCNDECYDHNDFKLIRVKGDDENDD